MGFLEVLLDWSFITEGDMAVGKQAGIFSRVFVCAQRDSTRGAEMIGTGCRGSNYGHFRLSVGDRKRRGHCGTSCEMCLPTMLKAVSSLYHL